MYTLVDFITHVKGIEYILSLLAIAVFLVFWESLKPRPFRTVVNTGKDDLTYIREAGGIGHVMKSVGKIAMAPFIGLAYIVMLPIGFFVVLAAAVVNLAIKGGAAVAGKSMTLNGGPWRRILQEERVKRKKPSQKRCHEIGSMP